MANQSIRRDKSVALKTNRFKKKGYVFNGWNTKRNGSGKAYKDKAKVKNLTAACKAITLYAQWKKAAYNIKFVANGGSGTMSTISVNVGASRTLPANKFTRRCYAFTGWNRKANGSGTAYKNKATVKNLTKTAGATVNLYAQWKLKSGCYTVTYVLNSGTNNSANPKAYYYKDSVITLKNPTRTGYTFKGWYTNAKFTGSKVTKIAPSAKKNVKLYAKWAVNKYTVKFSANGGTGTMAAKTYTYGKTYTLPANAFKKSGGYKFAGWNTKKDGSGKTYANKATVKNLSAKNGATVVLYAQWQLNVTDKTELNRACEIIRRTGEPLYKKLHGESVSYKHDADGRTIWSVSTRANGVWQYIYANEPNSWNTLGVTYCSGYGSPFLTMASNDSSAETYRSALLDGTYDFNNDPGDVYIGWSMYTSSTEKAAFQKMINNKISDDVFDAALAKYNGRTTSVYGGSCVIVYGKDSDGKLIGKYAGSVYYNNASNATVCYFVGINPKNSADYGKTVTQTLVY